MMLARHQFLETSISALEDELGSSGIIVRYFSFRVKSLDSQIDWRLRARIFAGGLIVQPPHAEDEARHGEQHKRARGQ
jgi:hypothetical protein